MKEALFAPGRLIEANNQSGGLIDCFLGVALASIDWSARDKRVACFAVSFLFAQP